MATGFGRAARSGNVEKFTGHGVLGVDVASTALVRAGALICMEMTGVCAMAHGLMQARNWSNSGRGGETGQRMLAHGIRRPTPAPGYMPPPTKVGGLVCAPHH